VKKGNFYSKVFLILIILMTFSSCQKDQKEIKYSDIAYFAEPVIQDFCAGFEKNDYKEFAYYFSLYFSKPIPSESLEQLLSRIGNTIGTYIPQSLSYKNVFRRKNNYTVIYTASFSLENKPVTITFNFEKTQNEFKLSSFNVDSPKLKNK